MTAKAWREKNPSEKGDIRDHANAKQLICLVNLENLNALFIKESLEQSERLKKLNQIAIDQLLLLTGDSSIKRLGYK